MTRRVAERQGGHVTRQQLLDAGLSSGAITYHVRRGDLIPVYRGVYAVGHLPTLPLDRAKAALLACGRRAALCHGSAATLWSFFKAWSFPFEVVVLSDRRPKGIRVHRSTALQHRDIRIQLGVRTTSPARTILDITPRLTERRLERIINDARLANQLRLADLGELLDRIPRHPGARRLRSFVEQPSGPTRSELEDAFRAFCHRYGLPRPTINATVAGYEVDALFEAEKLIVELDGYAFHSDRASFERDRNRDADTFLAGYGTVRITHHRITKTATAEARRLHALLAKRRGGE